MGDIPYSSFDMINDIRGETTHRDAKAAFDRGDFQEASRLYTELIQGSGYDSQYFAERVMCLLELEQYEEAVQDSKVIIDQDPGNYQGYLLAGRSSVMLKRFEEALALYQRGLQVDPKNTEIAQDLKEMQRIIVKEYEAKGSEKGYSAVKFCSQDPYPGDDMLFTLEKDILEKKYLQKADDHGIAIATRDTKKAMAEAMTGEQHRMRGDFPRALCHLSQAVLADPLNFAIRFLRAKAYHENGDNKKAVADYMAIPKAARHKDIWKNGGNVFLQLGLPVTAEMWFRRATKLSDEGDDECAMLFQQVRVKRLYDPLTVDFPIQVKFTQYGRAVYAKEDIEAETVLIRDEPIICGNSLDTWKLPACFHCGRSLLTPNDYFRDNKLTQIQRKTVEYWPEVEVIPCELCNIEKYCGQSCKKESWDRYHSVLCPAKTPATRKLYEICENNGKLYDNATDSWVEVWSAAYTPFILAKIWANVVCQVKNLMKEESVEEPSLEQWAKAKAPLRRFIAFGSSDAAKRFPTVHNIMKEIFDTCDPVVRYEITDKEFNGRYFQATCNLQSFSSPLNPYKLFLNNLNNADVQETMSMLQLVEAKPKDALFTGLFPLHACINHSCLNSVEVMDGFCKDRPGIWVKAKRDLKKDEELFSTYIDTKMPRKLRRAWLYRSFNFWCQCRRCQFEGDEPETCTNCLTPAAKGKKFPACGKCKKAWYCSTKCQKDAWKKGHREICVILVSIQNTDAREPLPPPGLPVALSSLMASADI